VLQDQTYRPVGASASEQADVRVVSATNRELAELVAAGEFREDLYYRLNLITLRLPPLRERRSDIALIATRLVTDLAGEYGLGPVALTAGAIDWLGAQPWPGNIRQLRQVLERTLLLVGKPILDQGDFVGGEPNDNEAPRPAGMGVDGMTLEAVERRMIVNMLGQHQGNISRVAKALGLSRAALYRRLEKHGLAPGGSGEGPA
jgi:two-component system NtrC family response regulator